jgi:predicted ferric reductase
MCSFVYRRIRVTDISLDNQALLSPTTSPYRSSLKRDWLLYFAFLAVLVVFAFFTTYMPDNWEYFTADRIAMTAHQRVDPTPDGYYCNLPFPQTPKTCSSPNCNFPLFMCPELPGATFTTKTYQLKDYWTIKVYPTNLFFFLFVILTSFCAMLYRSATTVYRKSTPKFYLKPLKMFITAGEVAVFLAISTLLILWTHYWAVDHNYNGYWPSSVPFDSEVIARMFGQIAVMFMSLLMVPAARDSVFSLVFGVSWEAGIKYHRWLGVLFLLTALAHMIGNWVWYKDLGVFPQDIIDVPMHVQYSIDNFTVPLTNLVFWITLVGIGVFAGFEYFRRNHFELFYYAHHVCYSALIPAVLWHAASAWEFLLPGVTLWFLDRLIRVYRSAKPVQVLSVTALDCQEAGQITEIRCQKPFDYYPGQYCFVNVAEISLLQWHPFTISTSSSTEISFHIKDMGPGTFTGRLHHAAAAMNALTIAVDGPYGLPIDFSKYRVVLLVAGGIGITPVKSIFESLRESPPESLQAGHMLWIARDVSLLHLMDNSTQDLPTGPFSAALFVDNPAVMSQSLTNTIQGAVPLNTHLGRPDIPANLSMVVGDTAPEDVLLFVCGPPGIAAICERTANTFGWHFHTETFAL